MRYVILGFGKFGRLALDRLLEVDAYARVVVVDRDERAMAREFPRSVEPILSDAIGFLTEGHRLDPEDLILPLVPFNVAAAYVLARRPGAARVPIPASVEDLVPNPFRIGRSDLCCSRADFICPDDCPEGDVCTVTGLPREPLHEALEALKVSGFTTLVLRSLQVLPGVGGYPPGHLQRLLRHVSDGTYLIATACKCHGILTAVHWRP